MRAVLGRAAGLLVVVGSIVAAVLVVRAQWSEVRGTDLVPGALPVVAAVAAHLVADGVLVEVWRRVLRTARVELRYGIAAWVWSVGQLTRYTFVSGVQIGGRAVVGARYGVSLAAGAVSTVVEIAWQTSLTAALALATAPWTLRASGGLAWLGWLAAAPTAVLAALLAAPRRVLGLLARIPVRRLSARLERVRLGRGDAGAITAFFAVNTGLRVAAFLALFAAVGGDVATDGLLAVGAWALGQLAGRLAVLAPGGIGPQEGVTALVLGPTLGPAALVLVGVSRLAEVVAELLYLGVARILRGRR